MKKSPFVCPETGRPLLHQYDAQQNLAALVSDGGKAYPLSNGVIDLTYPKRLEGADQHARKFYEGRADDYDKYLPLTFKTHNEDEEVLRNSFIDKLNLKPGDRVLDLACGTGRDSILIAGRLGPEGALYCQDISPDMIRRCIQRLGQVQIDKACFLGNALHLPFPDNFFDALYSFGALGEFSDIGESLAEMVRVTRPGGKIVVGDESIPVWLRDTEFAKILSTTNPQFNAELPLKMMPVEARHVNISYVINGVFYLIDFEVGEGEPVANFDFQIPGKRGGTYRTRYEGQLEGVTPETKKLAYEAIKKSNQDMHGWLDAAVQQAALQALEPSANLPTTDANSAQEEPANPGISVIIVCYNFESYIGDCIESIVSQTLAPKEIIICDDHSTDQSWDIIQSYTSKHPGLIRAVRQDKNLGAHDNATVGFEIATGELISALDGDDRWHPDKLKMECEALRDNPEAKLAYSNVAVIDEQGRSQQVWVNPSDPTPPQGDVLLPLFTKQFFKGRTSVFRNELIYRSVYEEFKHDRDVPVHLDWDFKIRICSKYKAVYTNQVLVEYRKHGSNIYQKYPQKLYESAEYVILKNLPLFKLRTNVEITHALNGANAFLTYLAQRVNTAPRKLTTADVFQGEEDSLKLAPQEP